MVRGEVGIPLDWKQGMCPHLQMSWETWGSCRSCGGKSLGFPLEGVTGISGPQLRLNEGESSLLSSLERALGLLSRCCRNKGPHVTRTGNLLVFFKDCCGRQDSSAATLGNSGASRVASGKSSLHSSCKGARDRSGVLTGESGQFAWKEAISTCFSSCGRTFGFRRGCNGGLGSH